MVRQVARLCRNPDDAEDLLHAAYLKLERYRAEHEVTHPRAFLVRAAVNIEIDQFRRDKWIDRDTPLDLPMAAFIDSQPLQDEVLAARQRLEHMKVGLARLPPRTREIFLMHRLDGFKYREIAVRLEISQSAVEKHVAKGALLLAEWMAGW